LGEPFFPFIGIETLRVFLGTSLHLADFLSVESHQDWVYSYPAGFQDTKQLPEQQVRDALLAQLRNVELLKEN
jgi:hypothetical protein